MKKTVGPPCSAAGLSATSALPRTFIFPQYLSNCNGSSPAFARLCVATNWRLHSVTEASRTVDSDSGSANPAISASNVLSLVGNRCLSHALRWRRYLFTAYSPMASCPPTSRALPCTP